MFLKLNATSGSVLSCKVFFSAGFCEKIHSEVKRHSFAEMVARGHGESVDGVLDLPVQRPGSSPAIGSDGSSLLVRPSLLTGTDFRCSSWDKSRFPLVSEHLIKCGI